FRGRAVHALFLTLLLPVAWGLAAPALGDGRWLGLADTTWFWIAVGEPVVHQLYVWIAWRAQLRWETFSGLFGRADFAVYGLVFYVLLALRPAVIAAVSAADTGSLGLSRGVASVSPSSSCCRRSTRRGRSSGTSGSPALRAATTSGVGTARCRWSHAVPSPGRRTPCTRSGSSGSGRSR